MDTNDLTILYYTANVAPPHFMAATQAQLLKAAKGKRIVSVSHKPMEFGDNIVFSGPRCAYSIYQQVLIGAREAKTKYVAMAEDDVLYPPEHFDYRPEPGVFAYDVNRWGIFTWVKPPVFEYRERRNMTGLTVTREHLIRTLEERFAKWPDPAVIPGHYFAEPGRHENHLGITPLKHEKWNCSVPMVMFSMPEALGFENLGTRKRLSSIQRDTLEPWGSAENVLDIYRAVPIA